MPTIAPETRHASSECVRTLSRTFCTLFLLLAAPLLAGAATFNYSGALSDPNQIVQIWFTLPSTTSVTIKTTSWAAGNFDPVLWLFDSNGNQVTKNDDACNGQGCSPVNRDSLISLTSLGAGTYTAILSTFDQHFWRAGAAGNPPGVIVTGWSYQGSFWGLPPNYAIVLTSGVNISAPFTQTIFPPSDAGPAAPSLISPAQGATSILTTPTLTWTSVTGAAGYSVYLGTTNPPTTLVQSTTNMSFTPNTALSSSTTYYWKVASQDPNRPGVENASLIWSFTTANAPPPPPAAPTLVSPGNGASGLSWTPTLSWNPVTGSNGYAVYLDTLNPPQSSTITSNTSFTPATALRAGTVYYWKIASRDPNNNNAESPSSVWSFTTGQPLPAPAQLSPANLATGVGLTPTLSWSAVAGSAGYTVYFGSTNPPTASFFASGTSFSPSTLSSGANYYWRIASRDPNNNNAESSSAVWSFTTAVPIAAPTLLSPANAATGVSTTPTLSWNAVSGTNGYTVYLGTTNPPTIGVQVTGTSYTPASALTAGATYYWMVASRDPNNSNKEANSPVWSFTTAAPVAAPTLLSPANAATSVSTSPTLTWNAVTGTNGYTVYLGTTNPPTTGIQVTGTSYTPATALTAGATYYWMVASRDPNNSNKEADSTVWSFTIAGPLPGYAYKRMITIAHANVPNTDQVNFPFLFNSTDAMLKSTANGGHVANANAYDIIFTSDAAGTQKLDHEIEYYNASTGQFIAWVRIPILSHLTDTTIYMLYGNTAITTSQENKPGVWDANYRAVYHMADHAANQTVSDATNLHPATNQAQTSTKATSGQIDGALSFDGNTDYATTADASDLQSANVKTVTFWMKPADLSGASTERILCEYQNASNDWSIVAETAGNADFNTLRADIKVAGVETHLKIADNSITAGVFYHVAVVFNNSIPSAIYLNGVSYPLLAPKQGILGYGTTARLTIGARNDNGRPFPGILDEIRISSAVRSADWIKAEYINQSNPGGFYVFGAESSSTQQSQSLSLTHVTAADVASPSQFDVYPSAGPRLESVVNGASKSTGPISPGEIVILNGAGFSSGGYSAPEHARVLPSRLGPVQVFFNGEPAPLLWVRGDQISALVPSSVATRRAATVWLERDSVPSNLLSLDVAGVSPGVFTHNASGIGAALAVNQDGELNMPSNPATAGSTVNIYATGIRADRVVSVDLGGSTVNATIVSSPDTSQGVVGITFTAPYNLPPGPVELVVKCEGAVSQPSVSVNIR